jgi:type 1 glutamine amidotransferase
MRALLRAGALIVTAACAGPAGSSLSPSVPPASVVPPAQRPFTVLVVTHTTGFRHSSIAIAEQTIAALGDRSGLFSVQYCRNAGDVARLLTPDALKPVQAVFFANTTGELGLPDFDGFLAWIRNGGAFLGAHSASDTYHGEPRYLDMLGGEFQTHGNQALVDVIVERPSHPAAAGLGDRFQIFDEIYHFTANNRGRVETLLSLDRAPGDGLPGENQPADMPISWTKTYGNGRVFYTALGHREEVWQDLRFQTHLLGAIRWALGTS